MTSRGTLFGVGLGPGDPELVTVKAARVIGEADVTPEGVIKLSLGRKRHVLLKPV